jgi:hypothetical protein
MTEPRAYALSPAFKDRVEDSVAWTEERSVNDPPPKDRRPNLTQQNVQRLRVTSGTPDTVAGVNYYPARVRLYDPAAGTSSDLTTFDAVKLFDQAGGTFAADDQVDARQVSTVSIGGTDWPAFAKLAASGGTDRTVRIDGQFVKDTDPGHALPLSPLCFFPGTVMKLAAAGWNPDPAFDPVWVVFWYTDAIVDNGADPPTVVGVDATKAHHARPSGFSYDPNDNGVTEHSGEMRPVYESTEHASAIDVQCDDDEPTAVLEG